MQRLYGCINVAKTFVSSINFYTSINLYIFYARIKISTDVSGQYFLYTFIQCIEVYKRV